MNQLVSLLPVAALVIGIGIEIISTNKKLLKTTSFSRIKPSSDHITLVIVIAVIITQIPILIEGYGILENNPTAHTSFPYNNLNLYIKDNSLEPISLSWYTNKNIVVYSNGEIVPEVHTHLHPRLELNDEFKKSMKPLESITTLEKNNLFIVYVYPEIPDCSISPLPNKFESHYKCAQFYLVESAAERNNKQLEIIDFPLPDDTPYIRTFRMIG